LPRQGGAAPHQGRGTGAPAGGPRARRGPPGHLQRRVDDRRLPRPPRRRDGRRGHLGLLLPPRLEKNICLALAPSALAEIGTRFTVDVGERPGAHLPSDLEPVDAVVVPKPFIDPTKEQPKGDVSALGAGAASATGA